ncbi:enterotoxin A family protein [Burkholderia sp. SIMBA_062]|uniref:enterotoxin A family protein n=1 Tax=Burkholderia sp. SIMBA_062 TaxID=3085803 RepID=UPI00397B0CBB
MTIFKGDSRSRRKDRLSENEPDSTSLESTGRALTVWRGDAISPHDLKRQGMFFPRAINGTRPNQPPADISLWNHINGSPTGMSTHTSGYVSTSISRMSAFRFLVERLGGNGYLYEIKITPNFIDAAGTLGGTYSKSREQEYSALGGIRFDQVKGWVKVSFSTEGRYKSNALYKSSRYATFAGGSIAPQLAGFPPGHWAWKKSPWHSYQITTGRTEQDAANRDREGNT